MNIFAASSYGFDAAGVPYLVAGLLAFGMGAAVLLYERFTRASRRFFWMALTMAAWLLSYGLSYLGDTRAVTMLWYRVGLGFVALGMPLVLRLTLELTGRRLSRPVTVGVWVLAAAMAAASAGPLTTGITAVLRGSPFSGWGPLALAYVASLTGVLGLVLHQFWQGYRHAQSSLERRGHLMMLSAVAVSCLAILDFFVPARVTFASGVTPVAMILTLTIMSVAATRYRTFSASARFATDEVLRAMGDAVLVCDGSGIIRVTNAEAKRLLGADDSVLLGSHISRWLRASDAGVPIRPGDDLASLVLVRDGEMVLRSAADDPIAVSVSMEPISAGGERRGLVLVARDIRHRLSSERALQAAERRYRSLFWHTPGPAYEMDVKGRIVAGNQAAERMVGMASTELRGRSFMELLAPHELERAEQLLEAVARGEPQEYELTLRVPGGGEREIRGVSIPIVEQGEVVGVFGVALDISEAARAKRELEVQRRYFAELFESSPEGIVLLDAETDQVLRVNAEFTRMFGYTTDEAVGRDLNELIVPPEMAGQGRQLNATARAEGRVRTETVRQRKDGTLVEVSLLARKLLSPSGREELYGVYRDIGDRRETERRLRQREEELRHAQKLEAVGKLAGGIAHDFNNLLTVINGHARFALEALPAGDALEVDLLEIEKAGMRAASLTQQLLAYSRRQVLHLEPLDPNAVVLEVQGMLRRLIGEHIRIETALTSGNARVRADRGQLEQVLVNLVVNARDAMPEGGTVTLETHLLDLPPGDDRVALWGVEPGPFVRIRVADSGVGMDPGTLERAFEPFFTTKEPGKGTGLGLATVFGIVKQSGGHVTAESAADEGTAFDVILPQITAAAPAPDVASPAPAPAPASVPATGVRGPVLVVEDEAPVRNLVVRVLERDGCVVVSAANGARALEIMDAHEGRFELVITDLVMPEMGGRELADRLRRTHPGMPILFMSGYEEDLVSAGDSDVFFLPKPFTPAALTGRVAALLSVAGGTG